jgi:hypothetical protein
MGQGPDRELWSAASARGSRRSRRRARVSSARGAQLSGGGSGRVDRRAVEDVRRELSEPTAKQEGEEVGLAAMESLCRRFGGGFSFGLTFQLRLHKDVQPHHPSMRTSPRNPLEPPEPREELLLEM